MYGKACKYEAASVSTLVFPVLPKVKLAESEEEIEGSRLECSPVDKEVPTPGGLGILQTGRRGLDLPERGQLPAICL